jgi:hypothetical protein
MMVEWGSEFDEFDPVTQVRNEGVRRKVISVCVRDVKYTGPGHTRGRTRDM